MNTKLLFLIPIVLLLAGSCLSQTVFINYAKASPQQVYVASILQKALLKQHYTLKEAKADYNINFVVDSTSFVSEAFSITSKAKTISITGGDEKGIIYGGLSLAEDLQNGIPLQLIKPISEKPHLPFRAIKFDMPWDTYRHSYALDLHGETCRDINYWETFLDMMAANRFNVLSLWNLHPYVYMIKPRNFPEASPFNETEMKEWQTLFHSIFRMARNRGIDTYIIPFNIFVSAEFSKAHNVAMDNLEHHFFVNGDTSEIVKRYTRECVTQLLQEYPDLTGMGLSTLR